MSDRLAEHVLDLVAGMGYTVKDERVQKGADGWVWRVEARRPDGEIFIAQHEDLYRAAVLLAEMVGAELEE